MFSQKSNKIDTIESILDTVLTGASYYTILDDRDVLGDIFNVYNGESENYITVVSHNTTITV